MPDEHDLATGLTWPRHLDVTCAACGRIAAHFDLLPPGVTLPGMAAGRDVLSKEHRLQRTGFLGTVTHVTDPASLQHLLALVERGDVHEALSYGDDLVGFYCPNCEAAYCDQCWDVDSPVIDEGFYDYTEATCPHGHRHIVDD